MKIEKEELVDLLIKAFNAGFNKYEVVEAGLESKEADIEVRWILTRYLKENGIENRK